MVNQGSGDSWNVDSNVGDAMISKRFVSNVLDATVVPGFSRIGYDIRSRMLNWQKVSRIRLDGHIIVITGPTSGLGLATAKTLASTGAHLVLVARNAEKCQQVVDELRAENPLLDVDVVLADMGDLSSVSSASQQIRERFPRVDVLVHNAGALLQRRQETPQGVELTIASHVLGPFLMTTLLRDSLRAANGRVVTVSSGGMYAASLPTIKEGQCPEVQPYNGSRQYALAKRLQVTLNEMWAKEEPAVEFVAMHPGWADTPGVQESIPGFRRVTRPILRSAEQGADTIAWLCAVSPLPAPSGTFWCDRETRSIHKTPTTRKSDSPSSRDELWSWCLTTVAPFT